MCSYAKDIKVLIVSSWLFDSVHLLMYRLNIAEPALSKAYDCQRLLAGIVVSNPAGTRMFVLSVVCVSLCVGLIPRPVEFYRMRLFPMGVISNLHKGMP
jgi:hypothetical protein